MDKLWTLTFVSNDQKKDTVLVSLCISGRSWHVEEDESSIVRFVDNDFIEFDSSVHSSDIRVISANREEEVPNEHVFFNTKNF